MLGIEDVASDSWDLCASLVVHCWRSLTLREECVSVPIRNQAVNTYERAFDLDNELLMCLGGFNLERVSRVMVSVTSIMGSL